MAKPQRSFACTECGYRAPQWMGRCPECGSWHSFSEVASAAGKEKAAASLAGADAPVPLSAAKDEDFARVPVGISELDRVLGGGLVPGAIVLIGGDPGIGKSTIMLQALHALAERGVKGLYVSGEESVRQVKMRGQRLSCVADNVLVASETSVDRVIGFMEELSPGVVVADSVQTLFCEGLPASPGSLGQVREVAFRLAQTAKRTGIPVFLVGHVTKEGAIAGPRTLEHMVDTVLYFEGDRDHLFRILRAVKNRFGSTNEIGVFEMREKGLAEVTNVSAVFLSERPENTPGSAVTACMEGTRPVLVEVQALVSATGFPSPRRTVLGLDGNRVALLAAVLEKRAGLRLMAHDLFVNVAGGVRITEPGADLAVAAAIASSAMDRKLPANTIILGEVGLTGEVRGVSRLSLRLREAEKMGFSHAVLPAASVRNQNLESGLTLVGVKTVSDAMQALLA
ncbi:MAG: DNA repair protein RadA [Thermodesulfobacteriota bacterium]